MARNAQRLFSAACGRGKRSLRLSGKVLALPNPFGYYPPYFEVGGRAHLFHLRWRFYSTVRRSSSVVTVRDKRPLSKQEFPFRAA